MTRTTIKNVEYAFESLVGVAKLHGIQGTENWRLDHNATYGGWKLCKITNEGGGEHDFSKARQSNKEFYNTLNVATALIAETPIPGENFDDRSNR
jgi:hypothetical protein